MSISFQNPLNAAAAAMMSDMFGQPAAQDGKTFLYDKALEIDSRQMGKLTRTAKQDATVELCGEGEIKTMSDGTRYQVTPRGWVKL